MGTVTRPLVLMRKPKDTEVNGMSKVTQLINDGAKDLGNPFFKFKGKEY